MEDGTVRVFIYKIGDGAQRRSAEMLARVFRKEFGVEVDYTKIPRDEYGKPQPVSGWHFSISHSGPYWGVAMAREAVGFDLQLRRPINERMRRRILTSEESGDLLEAWVLKEAYAKMLGTGIGLGFNKVSCAEIRKRCKVEDWSGREYVSYVVMT